MPPLSISRDPPPAQSPWVCLESLPGRIALPCVWRGRLGDNFEAVKSLFLQDNPNPAQLLPCPRGCGLAHDIVQCPDGSLAATCHGDPSRPHEIPLTRADITPLEVNWSRLGRALCQTLGLQSRFRTLPSPNTIQFGAWSAEAVPAILTVQACPSALRRVVPELVAGLKQPFLLFAPTGNHIDVSCLEFLSGVRAAFFSLDATVRLDADGRLCAAKSPGELFARFTPQPAEDNQQLFISVVALVHRLESIKTSTPPSVLQVFERRYLDQHSRARVAKEFGCSKGTIRNRLLAIKRTLGDKYQGFERYVPLFRQALDQMSDPKARRVYAKGLFGDTTDPED